MRQLARTDAKIKEDAYCNDEARVARIWQLETCRSVIEFMGEDDSDFRINGGGAERNDKSGIRGCARASSKVELKLATLCWGGG